MKFTCGQYPSLMVPAIGQKRATLDTPGEPGRMVQFANGELETEEEDVIAVLTSMAPMVKVVLEVEMRAAPKAKRQKKSAPFVVDVWSQETAGEE